MNNIFSNSVCKPAHNIIVKTSDGIAFVIDITKEGEIHEASITVLDKATGNKGTWKYQVAGEGSAADDKFRDSMLFVIFYLNEYNQTDAIDDIYNPCDCSLVSQQEQTDILGKIGLKIRVRAK